MQGPIDTAPSKFFCKQSNAPDIVFDLRGRNVFTAFANDDCDLAFIIEVGDALWKWNRIVGAGHFSRNFPKTPLSRFPGFGNDLLHGHVRFAEAVRPHPSQMRGIISADACNPALRPRRMNLDARGFVE
jgi:hypothetical protein